MNRRHFLFGSEPAPSADYCFLSDAQGCVGGAFPLDVPHASLYLMQSGKENRQLSITQTSHKN